MSEVPLESDVSQLGNYSERSIPMPTYGEENYNEQVQENDVDEVQPVSSAYVSASSMSSIKSSNQNQSSEILQTQMPAPILLDLGKNGGRVSFHTFEEALEWAEFELEVWRYIAISGSPAQRANYLQNIVEQQLNVPDSIAETAIAAIEKRMSAQDAAVSIRNFLDAYTSFRCVHSNSTLGNMAKVMERHRPLVLGMLAGATGSAKPEAGRSFDKPADKESYTFGYALALQFKSEYLTSTLGGHLSNTEMRLAAVVDQLEPAERSLQALHDRYQSLRANMQGVVDSVERLADDTEVHISNTVAKTKEELGAAIEDMWARLSVTEEEHARQMHLMRETLTSQMQVSASVEYWSEASKYHSEKSSQSMMWFIVSGLVSILIIAAISTMLFKSGMAENMLVSSLTMFVPISVALYMLSLLAKSRKDHESLANNAAERVAMMETFTALEFENRAEDSERVLMLNALFQPATTHPSNIEIKNNIADLLNQIKNKE
ncbi:MAG: hypothetical protein GY804_11055 [Alphaproteobacteria bacterium]|nr:hypothetical protein [Alphaproteobacteria bacterium]